MNLHLKNYIAILIRPQASSNMHRWFPQPVLLVCLQWLSVQPYPDRKRSWKWHVTNASRNSECMSSTGNEAWGSANGELWTTNCELEPRQEFAFAASFKTADPSSLGTIMVNRQPKSPIFCTRLVPVLIWSYFTSFIPISSLWRHRFSHLFYYAWKAKILISTAVCR